MFTFSSRNLSDDCTAVVPGQVVRTNEVDDASVLRWLENFAGLPAVSLVGSDALVYVGNTRSGLKLAVQHENDRLFATRVPEAANTAVAQTPEQIMAYLEGRLMPVRAPQTEGANVARPLRRTWRSRMNSRWTMAILGVLVAVVGYGYFSTGKPEGIEWIGDAERVGQLNRRFNGKYGATDGTGSAVLQIENGRLRVYPAGPREAGGVLLDLSYRYGLRGDGRVVLVVANGAVVEPRPDGSLGFGEAVYPRLAIR